MYSQVADTMHVEAGLNLLSIPVKNEGTPVIIFRDNAASGAYIYDYGYQTVTTVYFGQGFFMEFIEPAEYILTGDFIDRDTFYLDVGWHLIGSISIPVPVKFIQSEPPGIITDYIRYIPGVVNDTADTIKPGLGYWVRVWQSGKIILSSTGIEGCESVQPLTFSLNQNYPNPFNPLTQITFSVPKATNVTLKVYDILGQEIALLVNERKQAGEYNVTWNAEGVTSGVYFYRIVAGGFIQTNKMVVVK
jgi:hypothetical protein